MEYLTQGLLEWNLQLTEKQINQFKKYADMLRSWNERMNLTAVTENKDIQIKHFLDSLSIIRVLNLKEDHSLLDLGTGAGFPGIPIKICYPQIRITLVDSLQKRIVFLNEVIGELGLHDMKAVHGRAEDLGRNHQYRERYDLCVSRAVANLAVLSEYCLPFVKPGGYFVAYKGTGAGNEMQAAGHAINVLGGKMEKTESFTLPLSDYGRSLIMIKKTGHTPGKYPRRAGIPAKEPL